MQVKRIEKMKAEGRDVYEIRKQEEVLEETKMMVPDCHRRLAAAVQDLRKAVVRKSAQIKKLSNCETEIFNF